LQNSVNIICILEFNIFSLIQIKINPMKNILFISFLFTVAIAGCDKKGKNQYSNWTIDGENFSSNNVTTVIGKARMDMGCSDVNRFGISFNLGFELPTAGSFAIQHISGQDPDSVSVGFYKGSLFYVISPSSAGIISCSEANKKARYTLTPTWFVNYHNAQDSVLINGEFNEP
jgi:hypothetical protein